ncbi:MAG: insulinase family protein [Candidatus Solibacter usitatus]|nr:insulinase family protein [Candidatus Solibacter usitatus]
MKSLLAALVFSVPLAAQNLKDLEKRVTEFTLSNGLHFIVLQRTDAPVVSLVTQVNVGSANDPAGKTGLAHMLEHMAFKGTDSLGTTNWTEETKLLSEAESVYDKLESERAKGPRASAESIKKLEAALKTAIDKANGYVVKEAYSKIIQQNGGVGLNAGTSLDNTTYFYSLPSNRVELWFLLTSQVLKRPVMREFYKERDVVREERRMSFESSPQGKLQEALLQTSYIAHPQRSLIGWASDIESLRAKDSEAFFKMHYVPSNMVMVLAGDVDPKEVKRMADQYFSALPSGVMPPAIITREPKQEGERRVAIESAAQPMIFMGFKRPDGIHHDAAALTVLASALSSGRTGILYKELVEEKKLSLVAVASQNFLTNKFPGLFAFIALPAAGKTVEDNEKAILDIIERTKNKPIDDAVLKRVKTQIRAGLIRGLESNMGMAMQLASNYTLTGDWRRMYARIEEIEKVTAADVQSAAKAYLNEVGRTVVYSKTAAKGGSK